MASTWLDGVTYDLEVAFASNPWDTTPVWTSIGDRVRYWELFTGTTSVNTDFGPGTFDVELDNRDRVFDKNLTTGPYFGQLVPMKRVRATVTRLAVTFTIFTGWVVGWPQDWQVGDGTARMTVVDGTQFIDNTLPDSAYDAVVRPDAPTVYFPLQDSTVDVISGLSFASADLGGYQASTPQYVDLPAPVGASRAVTLPHAGQLYAPNASIVLPTTIEAWVNVTANDQVWVGATVGATTFMRFGVETDGDLIIWYSHLADNLSNPGGNAQVVANIGVGFHHIVMARSGSTLAIAVDSSTLVNVGLTAGTLTTSFNLPGYWIFYQTTEPIESSVSHFAAYPSIPATIATRHYNVGRWAWTGAHGDYGWEQGGARINRALDDAGFPANMRNISTGCTLQRAYLPEARGMLDYVRSVNGSEQGLVFFDELGRLTFRDRQWILTQADAHNVTFSDDGAGVGYEDGSPNGNPVDSIRNKIVCTYHSGAITRIDTASKALYREQREDIDGMTMSDPQDASNVGGYRLRQQANPKDLIPRLRINMRKNIATTFPAVLALGLGDVVTVERTPMNVGAQIVTRQQVLGRRHLFGPDYWYVDLYVAPAVPMYDEAGYWTPGDAAFGIVGAFDPLLDENGAGITDETATVLYMPGTGQLIPF